MTDEKIHVTQPFLPPIEEFLPYVQEIWNNRYLTNGGPLHQRLERELADYLGVEHLALFNNGTIALIAALQVFDLKGEVITTPFSFVATTNALIWHKNTPVFVDINPVTANLDPAKIEAAIMDLMPQIIERDHPFMGCCYGLGILTAHLGGTVSKENYSEPVGPSRCELTADAHTDPLTAGLPQSFEAFVGHKEAVQALPPGCTHLVSSLPCPFQMVRWGQNVYATQFHPEADAHDFEQRIRIYSGHGYFPPEDAERLIDLCHAAEVTVPGEILRRFAARYG